MDYFVTPAPYLGGYGWAFFILQAVAAAIGVYCAFFFEDNIPVRAAFARRIGYVLLIAGLVGVTLGILRLLNVPVLNQRFWFYALLLAEIGAGFYIYNFARTTYAGQMAEYKANSSKGRQRQPQRALTTQPVNPGVPPSEPRPMATTSRRDARRDRKRRKG
ncbi:hypothetical protein HC891_09960 [Candidatus Gracilibacteria bacterium]|nr:hypothetical protein [Candidatus Gracilibacteria bacterium]